MSTFVLNLDKVLQPKTAVHCKSKEEYDILSKLAHASGLKWLDGSSYIDLDRYSIYNDKTCFKFYYCICQDLSSCKFLNYNVLNLKDVIINKTISNVGNDMNKEEVDFIKQLSKKFTESIIKAGLEGNPEREIKINEDDLLNLKIALETSKTLEDFISVV